MTALNSAPTQSGTESDQRTALKSAPTQGGTEPNMERVQSQYIQIHTIHYQMKLCALPPEQS